MPRPHHLLLFSSALLWSSVLSLAPMVGDKLLARVLRNDVAGPTARSAVEFVVAGQTLGRVLPKAAETLAAFPDVFTLEDDRLVLGAACDGGATNEDAAVVARTQAVATVVDKLRADDTVPMLRGWRDEQFAVRPTFHSRESLTVERAAAPLFGAAAYGVFCNGFVREHGRPAHVWLGKRAADKPTWPGRCALSPKKSAARARARRSESCKHAPGDVRRFRHRIS